MKKVFLLGDSISLQYRPYLESYLARVAVYSNKGDEMDGKDDAFANLDIPTGANGGDSGSVRAFVAYLLSRGWRTDLFALNCGLHDIKTDPATGNKQIPPEAYRENLEAVFGLLQEHRIPLLWIRTTPAMETIHNVRCREFHRFGRDVLAYNAIADELTAARKIPVADLFSFTENLTGQFGAEGRFCDHVHYVEPVRSLQAAFLAGVIPSRLA